MSRSAASLGALLALGLAAAPARADRVVLRDGRVIEGEVVRREGGYEVRVPHGTVHLRADEVRAVERGPTRHELLEQRLADLDGDDPAQIAELARWCTEQGLLSRGRRLAERAEAVRARLGEEELRRRQAAATTPEAMLALARWCRAEGFEVEAADLEARGRFAALSRRIEEAQGAGGALALAALARALAAEGAPPHEAERALRAALALSPDDPEARRLLGYVRFRERWELRARADEILEAEHGREMRAQGRLPWRGAWLTADEHQRAVEAERAEAHREVMRREEQARAQAGAEREAAEARAATARAEREWAERDRHQAEAAEARNQAALLELQRQAAAAQIARLEEERAATARREAVERRALTATLRRRLAEAQAELREVRARAQALRSAPSPATNLERSLREAELRALADRAAALERERRELSEALAQAEALCR